LNHFQIVEDFAPLKIGKRKKHATAFKIMLTYDRNIVRLRALENPFQLATFLVGLPDQEICMVTHHTMSIKMV